MDPKYVAKAAQIASVLEVSGHPKPGNVHRTQDFPDMVFEDFLISGVVIGDIMLKAAKKGRKYNDVSNFHQIQLGKLILKAVEETNQWVANNTNLGIIMLLTPLCAASGMSNDLKEIRENVHQIISHTTAKDTVNLYKSISLADAGGMGERDDLDVTSDDSHQDILENNINIFQILEISAEWDMLARELTTRMPVTFETGFPVFKKTKMGYGINSATVHTFLNILSKFPDTLISRKYGLEKAQEVSQKAEEILNRGGILTEDGWAGLELFDKMLIENKLNPGTTADLTASSIMVALLDQYNTYSLK